MRKIATLLITSAIMITLNSCQKNGTHTSTGEKNSGLSNPPLKKINGTVLANGMSLGQIEVASVDSYRVRYGWEPTDYYTITKRTQIILNDILGFYSNPDSVARAMTDWAIQRGWIDGSGNFISSEQFSYSMLQSEPHAGLRQAYTTVYDSIKNGGTGNYFRTWALNLTNAVTLTNPDDIDRRAAANDILDNALDYFDGQTGQKPTGPDEVAAADQQGFNEGWMYAQTTGGGREVRDEWGESEALWHSFNGNYGLYWGLRFAIAASDKIACNEM